MRRDFTQNLSQAGDRRMPTAGEVRQAYLSLGTQTPQELGERTIRHFIGLTNRSVLQGASGRQIKNKLLGMLHYELGVAIHGEKPREASRAFAKSMRHVAAHETRYPEDYLRQQQLLQMTTLMSFRTDESERQHRLQQRATVRELGGLLLAGCEVINEVPAKRKRDDIFGALVEIAFAGTFLTYDETVVGAPVTNRQDKPRGAAIGRHQAIPDLQYCSAVDFNLLTYLDADAAPLSTTRAQIKAKERGQENMYEETILMLYADRDLFVDNLRELTAYGKDLARFDGTPGRQLEIAQSNIELAREQHCLPPSAA